MVHSIHAQEEPGLHIWSCCSQVLEKIYLGLSVPIFSKEDHVPEIQGFRRREGKGQGIHLRVMANLSQRSESLHPTSFGSSG